jgi:CRP-like cAMP-binding protein
VVYKEGNASDKFYIIIEGEVSIQNYNKYYGEKSNELKHAKLELMRLNLNKQSIIEDFERTPTKTSAIFENVKVMTRALEIEIDKKKEECDELQKIVNSIPEYTELYRLGNGKSFGDKALITDSLRDQTVVSTRDCHFAVMSKADYDKVLRKIEVKA